MRRSLSSALILMGTIIALSACALWLSHSSHAAEEGKDDRAQAFAKLERGMSPEQVRQRVGAPKRIARQILYHRHLEQWIYDVPVPARLQFDCPRGQVPQLVWKQVLVPEPGRRERGK
jgi:hypothetical protein